MCQVGDIILIEKYKHGGQDIGRHSFVVIEDEQGKIKGATYDMMCNVLSSFKSKEQREKKLGYPGNFEIVPDNVNVLHGNQKSGYIKADQIYYFAKDSIIYRKLGEITEETLGELLDFIELGNFELIDIIENL